MKFHAPLVEGVLVARRMRFLADVRLKTGEVVVAHCANSGSMLSVKEPGSRVWLSPSPNPDRKLKYTWEIIEIFGHMVGINTMHPNKLVYEAVEAGQIKELKGYTSIRREQKYGKNSRIDLLLEKEGKPPCYVEIKNVTMKRGDGPKVLAEFPDSVTERGAKHLVELAEMVKLGHRAVMFYLIQRGDAKRCAIAADIDPEYAKGLKKAVNQGVEVLCYGCEVTPEGITIGNAVTMDLPA